MNSMKQMALVLALVMSFTTLFAAEKKPRSGKGREAVVKAYDANKDGKLDKTERSVILKAYDANKDGKLDKDEKRTLAKSVAGKQQSQTRAVDESVYVLNGGKMVAYGPKYTFKDWTPVKRTTEKIS